MNKIKSLWVFLLIFNFFLISCGGKLPGADARKVPTNPDERVRKNIEEGKGFRLMDQVGGKGGTNFEFASSNELWRSFSNECRSFRRRNIKLFKKC